MARWRWLGLCCFLLLPGLVFYERYSFDKKEPYYAVPVRSDSNVVKLRNDTYGKGYFGSSRNGNRTHAGVDLVAALESPVFASKSGRVFFAGYDKGYGQYVEISHPDGLSTRYAHLTNTQVKEGEWVNQNQLIGTSGKSGNANDPRIIPHLHFEIRYKKYPLNPTKGFLDPRAIIQQR